MQSSVQDRHNLTDPSISRNPSPSFRHLHPAGEFTPEISPLDEFINRGRLLSKQLGTSSRTGSPTLTPLTVHASLRRTGRSPSPLSRSRTVGRDSTSSPSLWLTVTPGDPQIATPIPLEDRPVSSYPRFSTVSSASTEDEDGRASERDSVMSGATSTRDSNFTLMGGFLNPDRNPPNLQQLGVRRVEHEGYEAGRVSMRPVIVGSAANSEAGDIRGEERRLEGSPRLGVTNGGTPNYGPQGPQQRPHQGPQGPHHELVDRNRGRDRRRDIPQGGESRDNAAAYSRSRSQPPRSSRRPPPRQYSETGDSEQPQYPVRQDSDRQAPAIKRQLSDRQLPLRQDSNQYRPYRQDSSSSGTTSIGPLSRQGSAENEVFPVPQRQGSGRERLVAPLSRQGSVESEMFTHLHRQGSGNSDRLHPHRQDSRGSENRVHPRSPNRQNSGESGVKYMPYRAGPPTPISPSGEGQYRRPSQGGPGDLHERRRPSRQDSNESDRGRHVGRSHEPQYHPGPQRSPTHSPAPMILPMVAGMRAVSPESMAASPVGGDSGFAFGPPTPLYGTHEHFVRPGSAASQTPSISPSICSIGGTSKPTFNFSRPLSNRPSMDTMKQGLKIPQRLSPEQSPLFPDEYSIPTPVSMSEEFGENGEVAAPTVVYSRFALPRGRTLERNSIIFLGSGQDQLLPPGHTATHQQRPGMPRAHTDSSTSPLRPPSPSSPPSTFLQPAPPARDRAATYSRSPSASRPQLLAPGPRPHTSASSSPRSPRSPAQIAIPPTTPTSTMSTEDHVQKGIELHESGSLQESTYHLRLAANGGHPTGMLLYALACRHGWGMKANPKEGVMWLKKVTELASSEVADDEMKGGAVNLFEKKGRRAQFALSIYELGVSHMNGWGTEMDKGLAVRCFEIAGRKLLLLSRGFYCEGFFFTNLSGL